MFLGILAFYSYDMRGKNSNNNIKISEQGSHDMCNNIFIAFTAKKASDRNIQKNKSHTSY